MSRFDTEPDRGRSLAALLSSLPDTHPIIASTLGITADIVVFGYPIFLVRWYLWDGWTNWTVSSDNKKNQALTIFFSVLCSMMITIITQLFATKQRPIWTHTDRNMTESILHDYLPSTSFPSDHATVSFAFGISCLLLAYQTQNIPMIRRGWLRFGGGLLTSVSRIAIHLHRPTDIVGGFIAALCGSVLIFFLHPWLSHHLYPLLHSLWTRLYKTGQTLIVKKTS
ncbi:MAG: phosphatase PAP2 family protein [Candidatus Absconditabacterales bacterium]|nr:phosphatase PAP2 family protein [Candidatus Absconditabacterales bacterium]